MAAVAAAYRNTTDTGSGDYSSGSGSNGSGGGGGGGDGSVAVILGAASAAVVGSATIGADDATQFVTDSEEESDDDMIFGVEAISVDAPLHAEHWRSREGSLDPELASPNLSPRTLLSIEQMDSLRVERGLKGTEAQFMLTRRTLMGGAPTLP